MSAETATTIDVTELEARWGRHREAEDKSQQARIKTAAAFGVIKSLCHKNPLVADTTAEDGPDALRAAVDSLDKRLKTIAEKWLGEFEQHFANLQPARKAAAIALDELRCEEERVHRQALPAMRARRAEVKRQIDSLTAHLDSIDRRIKFTSDAIDGSAVALLINFCKTGQF
jgi:chromosome segregation ATPase